MCLLARWHFSSVNNQSSNIIKKHKQLLEKVLLKLQKNNLKKDSLNWSTSHRITLERQVVLRNVLEQVNKKQLVQSYSALQRIKGTEGPLGITLGKLRYITLSQRTKSQYLRKLRVIQKVFIKPLNNSSSSIHAFQMTQRASLTPYIIIYPPTLEIKNSIPTL